VKTETDRSLSHLVLRIRDILKASRRVMVVSHLDPDGDAIGTQLAFGHYLRDIGKQVLMVRDSEIPGKYLFLPEIKAIIPVGKIDTSQAFDTALVLECPCRERMGAAAGLLSDQTTVVNIDHHSSNSLSADVSWVDITASSVGELAFEYFRAVDYAIGPEVATQLFTAILTDTGRFRFECTSPRTLAVAGELVRAGADPRMICDRIYYDFDPATVLLTGLVLSRLEYHDNGRLCFMTLTHDMLQQSGADPSNTEGLVDYTLYPRGVEVGALVREIDSGTTKISLRSRAGIDVASLAKQLGGGGHPNAAGCRLPMPVEAAKRELVRLLQEARETKA